MKENMDYNPRTTNEGGDASQSHVLRGLAERLRTIFVYYMAQLTMAKSSNKGGFLLVVGSYSVDDLLLGEFHKYDSKSGDINPIGGLNRIEIVKMLKWFKESLDWKVLSDIITRYRDDRPENQVLDKTNSKYSYVVSFLFI